MELSHSLELLLIILILNRNSLIRFMFILITYITKVGFIIIAIHSSQTVRLFAVITHSITYSYQTIFIQYYSNHVFREYSCFIEQNIVINILIILRIFIWVFFMIVEMVLFVIFLVILMSLWTLISLYNIRLELFIWFHLPNLIQLLFMIFIKEYLFNHTFTRGYSTYQYIQDLITIYIHFIFSLQNT